MDTYARYEALAIHLLTGALFAALSALLTWQAAMHSPLLLATSLVITSFAAWGWWVQATVFVALLRGKDLEITL